MTQSVSIRRAWNTTWALQALVLVLMVIVIVIITVLIFSLAPCPVVLVSLKDTHIQLAGEGYFVKLTGT